MREGERQGGNEGETQGGMEGSIERGEGCMMIEAYAWSLYM